MNPLARHYSRFRVTERILLTGHSHQAWPDEAYEAQQRAWLDAAEYVDDKWTRAAERAAEVSQGYARLLGDAAANIALGENTHELVTRWLSALPLCKRPRIVATDGEFQSVRRQLDRLAEEPALTIVRVAARPADTLAERLGRAVNDSSACVIVSSVLYETAEIVPDLDAVATACTRVGAELLIDAYHHLNVVPFDLSSMGLSEAFVVGGGYKYCQLGEGNAFLRVPAGRRLRPVLTGWFAEFATRAERSAVSGSAGTAPHEPVQYGPGAAAFAGATYDPTSHYRAAAVFQFHERQELIPERLRDVSRQQVARLKAHVEALDVDVQRLRIEPMPDERRAGFLALRTPHAASIVPALRARNVFVDARGDILRMGPAPYLDDRQLDDGVAALGETLSDLGASPSSAAG
jgi:kynureninase